MTGAAKFDQMKMMVDLLASETSEFIAAPYTFGQKKYTCCEQCQYPGEKDGDTCPECGGEIVSGAHNWFKGMKYSRLIASGQRHFDDFKIGDEWDADSGCMHLSQAIWNLITLLSYRITGNGIDDRRKLSEEQLKVRRELKEEMTTRMQAALDRIKQERSGK